MEAELSKGPLRDRLIEDLYSEALQLAEASRRYFEIDGCDERDTLPLLARAIYSSESLKVTTRLLHALAWLLTQRAVGKGELSEDEAMHPSRRLPTISPGEATLLASLPRPALALIRKSEDFHRRVARLNAAQRGASSPISPVRALQERLRIAF